jgi:hypothetical protein
MKTVQEHFGDILAQKYRNIRGLGVGLRCAFADAHDGGLSPRRMAAAVALGVRAGHDFAAFAADRAELYSRGGHDGRLHNAWNRTRRALFESQTPPPDNLGAVWQPFSAIIRETRGQYAALAADFREKHMAVKICLKPEYAHWGRQWSDRAHCVRLLDRMDERMNRMAADVDAMGPSARLVFLRSFTPDMRRVDMVPA